MNLKERAVRRFDFRAEEAQRSAAREALTSGAAITTSYLAMNAAATLLAGFGLLQNSPAVIIGAMLVAMLLGPIVGIALRYHEDKRETWLTGEQVEDLLAALDGYPDQSAADAIRLLIVTGVHEGEVLGATWDQFDLKRGNWTKPSHHTKQKKIEHTPLSDTALQLLRRMHATRTSLPVFPGQSGARVTIRRPWSQVARQRGLRRRNRCLASARSF